MAVLTRDEFFARLHDKLSDDTSDESISLLEDMTDTFNFLEQKANGDGEDWEKKYKELDENWKKRYRHRFFSGGVTSVPSDEKTEVTDEYEAEEVTVEDLFTKKED